MIFLPLLHKGIKCNHPTTYLECLSTADNKNIYITLQSWYQMPSDETGNYISIYHIDKEL